MHQLGAGPLLIEHEGKRPDIASSAYVAETAVVCGDVRIGPDSRVLFGAVVTADGGPVEIGSRSIVMENAVIRARERHPVRLGDHVLVGPHAHLNGVTVEDDVFIATGVSAFPGAHLEREVEARINSIIHVNTRVACGTHIPIGWIAVGDPAELFAPDRVDDYWPKLKQLDFPGTLFGIAREDLTMEKLTSIYVELFGRHRDDLLLIDALPKTEQSPANRVAPTPRAP
jgi:carbonic anhydrase/acetyltransferase-like protein (isoleucine patch superfamily)